MTPLWVLLAALVVSARLEGELEPVGSVGSVMFHPSITLLVLLVLPPKSASIPPLPTVQGSKLFGAVLSLLAPPPLLNIFMMLATWDQLALEILDHWLVLPAIAALPAASINPLNSILSNFSLFPSGAVV